MLKEAQLLMVTEGLGDQSAPQVFVVTKDFDLRKEIDEYDGSVTSEMARDEMFESFVERGLLFPASLARVNFAEVFPMNEGELKRCVIEYDEDN